jgi:hypothetical protein
MPKRRVRTAAQVAASRRNLEKARKAKGRKVIPRSQYHGKMIDLYHFTDAKSATAIVRQGFSSDKSAAGSRKSWTKLRYGITEPHWFTKDKNDSQLNRIMLWKHSGKSPKKLSVKVPFRSARPDPWAEKGAAQRNWVIVDSKNLVGRKIRRIK